MKVCDGIVVHFFSLSSFFDKNINHRMHNLQMDKITNTLIIKDTEKHSYEKKYKIHYF